MILDMIRKLFHSKFGSIFRFVLFAFLILLATVPGAGQSLEPKPADAIAIDAAAIEKLIESSLVKSNFVGGSVAVMHEGKIVFAKGFGKRSLKGNKPVGTETKFNVGSVSKQFTAAAVLLLAEEGKLSVHDKVAKYFPNLPQAEKVTLLDLMNHVSGYADYYPLDLLDRRMLTPISPDLIIENYAAQKPEFEPGAEFSYSNTGYVILGRVVEKASGKTLADFFSARFFEPLGLKNTIYAPRKRDSTFADGYTSYALSDPEPAPVEADGWSFGAGGIFSTAADLAKWDLALVEGKILKPDSLRLMTARRVLNDGTIKNYGCGLEIETIAGDTVWTHGGATSGFTARNTVIASTKSAIVLLSNADFALPGAVLHGKFLRSLIEKQPDGEQVAAKKNVSPKKPKLIVVEGIPADEAAKTLLRQMQSGKIERRLLGEEFNYFLSPRKLRRARAKLKPFGELQEVRILNQSARGGMESTALQFIFASGKLHGSMFRSPDGKIQEFVIRQ